MRQIEEFISVTACHLGFFFFFFCVLGSKPNKQHGFSDRYVVVLTAYLHKSVSGASF